jgi:hypothetical protein
MEVIKMRYFELIQKQTSKAKAVSKTAAVVWPENSQTVRIPAGAGPVRIRIVDGKVSIISDDTATSDQSTDTQ